MPLTDLFHSGLRPWSARRAFAEGGPVRALVVDDEHNSTLALTAYLGAQAIDACAVCSVDSKRSTWGARGHRISSSWIFSCHTATVPSCPRASSGSANG